MAPRLRIVVTGAAGFIGSVLSTRAIEQGHTVIALDDLSRGLNILPDSALLHVRQHDCQGGFLEAIPGIRAHIQERPIVVVHLAAGTGSLDRPLEELRALNVEMTKRVYADAVELGAKAFAFPTTSLALEVPDSPYVISKEEAFDWIKRQHEIAVLPLRFFNVSGAYKGLTERRRHEVHLIPRMVECFKTRTPLTINGGDYGTPDGTPSRDFVNVLDVVDFILWNLLIMVTGDRRRPAGIPQPDGAIWVGTGWLTTVLDAADIFRQWMGPLELAPGPRRAFDCGSLRCNDRAVLGVERTLGRALAPAWVSIRDEVEALLR